MNFDIEETAYLITIINKTNNYLKYYVWIYSSIYGATTGLQSMHTTSIGFTRPSTGLLLEYRACIQLLQEGQASIQ